MLLKILKNTTAKQSTASASTLPDNQKQSVAKDNTYAIHSWSNTGNHVRVALEEESFQGQNTWFFFGEHVQIIESGEVLYPIFITREQIEAIFEKPVDPILLLDLNRCLNLFSITTPERIRNFISQIAHESGGFQWLNEIADGWDYEGREDLGNIEPGDGPRFKGAGVIQLTGRANYQRFSDFMGDPKIMDGCEYVAKTYPVRSAGWFWHVNGFNDLCDAKASVREITRRVNGGYNGLEDRLYYYNLASEVIPGMIGC